MCQWFPTLSDISVIACGILTSCGIENEFCGNSSLYSEAIRTRPHIVSAQKEGRGFEIQLSLTWFQIDRHVQFHWRRQLQGLKPLSFVDVMISDYTWTIRAWYCHMVIQFPSLGRSPIHSPQYLGNASTRHQYYTILVLFLRPPSVIVLPISFW